jgi:LCP family protein required for cell wall assembly
MNILLIGLDSRKDQNGDDLPWSLLKHLHAGDSDDGGYNTNTLILAHVGADDKVSAFSIPRDDWVSFNGVPGYHHIKIKEAYGLTKQYVEQKMIDKGVSDQKQLETKGREAARAATLKAVRQLTGAPIDYFAEVNLAGFYDLAKSLGGVDVCLKHAVYDDFSGADFPAGPQRLDAAQSLAFVRQRHGLENGDLDRTHRQQAVVDYVLWKLRHQGTFTDLAQLGSLLSVARTYLVTDSGWNLLEFLPDMNALSGDNLTFKTLPITGFQTIDGQAANVVDPALIRHVVHQAFYPAPKPASHAPASASGRASRAASGQSASASVGGTGASATPTASSSPPTSSSASPTASSGPAGGAVTVSPDAPYGIPCVN